MLAKKFNVNGVCYPDRHYMVDLSGRLKEVRTLVDHGDYFIINRARQYGKTTLLRALKEYLLPDYIVISMSFQKFSSAKFCDEYTFSRAFARDFAKRAQIEVQNNRMDSSSVLDMEQQWKEGAEPFELPELFEALSNLCATASAKIVLMIDEVDQASNNQVFLDFLGLMREYYLNREEIPAFYSVILAGVYDVKNIRMKIRPEAEHRYNSPWNISADFDVDMSFSPEDILTMLQSYESEHHTGMDLQKMSEEIYAYTEGYPYLVSCLCKKLDEAYGRNPESCLCKKLDEAYGRNPESCLCKKPGETYGRNAEEPAGWNADTLRMAVRDLLKERNTLFEDVIKNIRNNREFANLADQLLVNGASVVFERSNPAIDLGVMFGILKEKDGKTVVSNVIFETLIMNYFTSVHAVGALLSSEYIDHTRYVHEGRLDMEKVVKSFAAFLKSEYRKEDGTFIERQGRLLFLGFLRPIINGAGFYAVEPQTRKNRRMDILIFYGQEEFIVELKIWRGAAYEQKGYDQLADYLEARGQKRGYMVSFCRNARKPQEAQWISHKGCSILEVIAEC